jgi:ATP-dependent Clp protease adaptor protein ClpS
MGTMHELETHSKHEILLDEPKKYKVYLLNDNYTSMDFVVDVLVSIFHKTNDEAIKIMFAVHNDGKGLCGVYTYDIAETKVGQVAKKSKDAGFPLKAEVGGVE